MTAGSSTAATRCRGSELDAHVTQTVVGRYSAYQAAVTLLPPLTKEATGRHRQREIQMLAAGAEPTDQIYSVSDARTALEKSWKNFAPVSPSPHDIRSGTDQLHRPGGDIKSP